MARFVSIARRVRATDATTRDARRCVRCIGAPIDEAPMHAVGRARIPALLHVSRVCIAVGRA